MFDHLLKIALVLFALTACASNTLLDNVSLTPDAISPQVGSANAATTIRYTLGRAATVSIYLLDERGARHDFRADQPRAAGAYDARFDGAVNDRVLRDGKYTIVVEAKDGAGQIAKAEKSLTITGAD